MTPLKKIDPKSDFPKMEEEILAYWDANDIFRKSVNKDAPKGDFVFYEGPPTANGKPGLHHVLARSFKDAIPRYKTMKGYRVNRKAGWDTHGLPVELQVEKALGLRNKLDIENIVPGDARASVIEFNKKCKESVWEYRDLWEKLTKRMGYWVDMEHPYVTYEDSYIESVWWQFAQIAGLKDVKGDSLLYRGHKVVPYCYRCGTALSSHEVAQGYKEVKDNSVYVKFKVKPGQKIGDFVADEKTYLVAWTTTPWTLPGNVALAVRNDVKYVSICFDNNTNNVKELTEHDEPPVLGEEELERHIIAKDLYDLHYGGLEGSHGIENEFDGVDIVGITYHALYEGVSGGGDITHRVVSDQVSGQYFITTDTGTGIVHIAPAFGEDDANVARENGLLTLHTVDLEGKMTEGFPGAGIPVKKLNDKNRGAVDDLIITDLKARGLLLKEEAYEHEYPHCWRCDTPLIYYAKPSWFIAVSKIREELVKNAEAISWVPEHIKEGRFGEWLRGAKDWAISRERYWGTPIPVWECSECGERVVIESKAELEKLSGKKSEDLHKPYIDDVTWVCACGKGTMKRTPEVLDVWFDSGAMPLAQFGYPEGSSGETKEKIGEGKYFPADYISEAIDQTRGWFYTLHAIATLLHKAGVVNAGNAYRNVVCLGHILDSKGKKMSKSKGNVVEPFEMFGKYGADALRWYLYSINQPGLPKRFDEKGMRDVMNRVFRMLWNSYSFFTTYAAIDGWKFKEDSKPSENLLDRWILSELQVLIREVDEALSVYDMYTPTAKIESFIDNLSNWYIRRNRKRFWKNENDGDKDDAYATLYEVLVTLSKLMAPFTPFLAEEIYRNLMNCHSGLSTGECAVDPESKDVPESVHLAEWPEADVSQIDRSLREDMLITREIVAQGLKRRAEEGVKIRQPLSHAYIRINLGNDFVEIIQDELNVKVVEYDMDYELHKMNKDVDIEIDFEITPQLALEGEAREIIRAIQEGRKKAGFEVSDRITLGIVGKEKVFDGDKEQGLSGFGEEIARETLATEIVRGDIADADYRDTTDIEGGPFTFSLKRNV
ncbi:MAG TPA: isoleucine--tRNA ligase [Candidatus Fimivivens sp.]|nr:isoleucine--tRNA ligase [Candidatus Fimivivens sp.]